MQDPIILTHGALGSKNQLKMLAERLSENFSVLSMDFEGHGEYHSDVQFSIDLFTRNLEEFIDRQKLWRVNLFGYSMGGYVALDFAGRHPDQVGKVITLGTKFDWTSEFALQEIKMLDPNKIEEKVPKFAQYLEQAHSSNDWKEVVRKTAGLMLGLGNGKRMVEDDFRKIKSEVLVMVGESDHMVTLAESERIVELLPKGQLMSLNGTPHQIEKIDQEELARIIADQLQQ
ncbi:MAG: alpha/beta fold hydrolase [Cyclobacteriaceae bacterium]